MNIWMALPLAFPLALTLSACTALQAPKVADTHQYTLDAEVAASPARNTLVLAISMPGAWPGFDTPQMAYRQRPLELAYFVTQRWTDTPAHMLRPLLVQSLEPVFQSVVTAPGPLPADIRLDTEIIRMQQDFTVLPSRAELVVRAQLTDLKARRVIAVKVFDESVAATSEDAYGGVMAANRALQRILERLTEFCVHTSLSK